MLWAFAWNSFYTRDSSQAIFHSCWTTLAFGSGGFLSNTCIVRGLRGRAQVTPRAGATAGTPLTQQLVGSNTPSCISAIRDAYKSATKAPTSSAPPARTHNPLFLQVRQHSALRARPVP